MLRPLDGSASLEWAMRAACRRMDADLFFSDDHADIAEAKSACWRCPGRVECLSWAIKGNMSGVFGATTKAERDKLTWRRDRVFCPVCRSDMVLPDGTGQICVACAHTWHV